MSVDYDDDLLTLEEFAQDLRDRSWMKDAACKGIDTNIFFPERGDMDTVAKALEICSECSVQKQCRDYGNSERVGIWGGASTRARVLAKRAAKKSK
jgi:WhiB family redox-sensing transcriptional regulator